MRCIWNLGFNEFAKSSDCLRDLIGLFREEFDGFANILVNSFRLLGYRLEECWENLFSNVLFEILTITEEVLNCKLLNSLTSISETIMQG